ncbi:MAG: alpha/beta hydrolase [Bacteroidota bacterium]
MHFIIRMIIWFLGLFAVALGSLVIIIWIKSPGTTPKIEVVNNIAEIKTYKLNGEDQAVILRGVDRSNPIVLFLQGGPGSPEFPVFYAYNRELEQQLTFAHWEQRGSGLSYHDDVDWSKVTLDQLVSDGIVLAEKLKGEFGQEKVFLLGHSWGTMLGMHMIKERPDLFHAFFAVGQVANQRLGEKLSYEWVLDQALQDANEGAMEELRELDPMMDVNDPAYMDYILAERKWVDHYGGSFKQGSIMMEFVQLLLLTPEYSLSAKMNYMSGNLSTLEELWPTVLTNNLFETVTAVEVPVYIFQGSNDYQTPYSLARQYFDSLDAPDKAFFTFDNSAHGVMYEEPEKFNQLLLELVEKNN